MAELSKSAKAARARFFRQAKAKRCNEGGSAFRVHDSPTSEALTTARRNYKRDRKGRFASTGRSRTKRVGKKIDRKRRRYIRGSAGSTVRLGRIGPGGEYTGVHVGAKLAHRKCGAEYSVGVSGGKRIASAYRQQLGSSTVHNAVSASRWGRW